MAGGGGTVGAALRLHGVCAVSAVGGGRWQGRAAAARMRWLAHCVDRVWRSRAGWSTITDVALPTPARPRSAIAAAPLGRELLGALGTKTPMQQCLALNIHSYLLLVVVLPLLLLLPLERRARRRHRAQLAAAAAAASASETAAAAAAAETAAASAATTTSAPPDRAGADVPETTPSFSAAPVAFFFASTLVWCVAVAAASLGS